MVRVHAGPLKLGVVGCWLIVVGLKRATENGERITKTGGLAQLARAPALHAGGQRFDSVILHQFYLLALAAITSGKNDRFLLHNLRMNAREVNRPDTNQPLTISNQQLR